MAEVEGASQYDDLAKLLSDAKLAFRNQFHCDPTVASCAPGRVNLIGEHTDYNDGFVFPMVSIIMHVMSWKHHFQGSVNPRTLIVFALF